MMDATPAPLAHCCTAVEQPRVRASSDQTENGYRLHDSIPCHHRYSTQHVAVLLPWGAVPSSSSSSSSSSASASANWAPTFSVLDIAPQKTENRNSDGALRHERRCCDRGRWFLERRSWLSRRALCEYRTAHAHSPSATAHGTLKQGRGRKEGRKQGRKEGRKDEPRSTAVDLEATARGARKPRS